MNLLDTHTLVWFINGDKQLSNKGRRAIENELAENFISIASIWEIGIKISLGKLELTQPFTNLSEQILQNNFHVIAISLEDVFTISTLDFHHRDPFDRMIAAQSLNRKMTLITKDNIFKEYNVQTIW